MTTVVAAHLRVVRAGQLAQRAVGAVLVVPVGLAIGPPGPLVAGDGQRREAVHIRHLVRQAGVAEQARRVERLRQVVVVVEVVVAAAQREHGGGVQHVRVVDDVGLDDAIELVAAPDELIHGVVIRVRLVRHLPEEEAAQRHRVVEVVIHLRGDLVRLVRQQVGHGEVRVAVIHLRVRRREREVACELHADRIQAALRNLVVREGDSRERVLDRDLRAVARHTVEVAGQLGRRRHEERALLRLVVDVLLASEPEERLVLHDGAARAAAAVAPVLRHVRLTRNARRLQALVILQLGNQQLLDQRLGTEHRVAGSVEIVGARLRRHVHHAAAGAPHLGVVGVDLHLHVLHRFDGRVRRGAVLEVGDRESVDEVVVGAHRAATHRHRRVADLILHPVPVRVAARLHRRLKVGHQEDAAAGRRDRLQRFGVEHVAGRRVHRVDERRLAGDRDRFLERADFERDVQPDDLLHADGHVLPLECLVALHRRFDGVGTGFDGGEGVLAHTVGDRVARHAVRAVHHRHGHAGDDALRVFHHAAHATRGRLRMQIDWKCREQERRQ